MTAPAHPAEERASFSPPRRPVARFVGAIALVAAPFAALWATGAIAPRVSVMADGREFDSRSETGRLVLQVHNSALAPVRVEHVTVKKMGPATPGIPSTSRGPSRVRLLPSARSVRVPALGGAFVTVEYDRGECSGASGPRSSLQVRVRGLLGRRTAEAYASTVDPACFPSPPVPPLPAPE